MRAITASELSELARAVENPKPVLGVSGVWALEYNGRSEQVTQAQLDRLRANVATLQSRASPATMSAAAANPSAQRAVAQLAAHRAPTGDLPPGFAERWLIPELTANRDAWKQYLDNPAIAALLRTHDHIQHVYGNDPEFKAWMKDPSYRPASAPAAPPEVKAAADKPARNEPTALEKQAKASFPQRTTPLQRKAVAEGTHKMQTFIGQHERALLGIGPDLSWEQKALRLLPGYGSGEALMDAYTGTDMIGRKISRSAKLKGAGKSLALDLLVILQPEEILFEGMGAEGVAAAEPLEAPVIEGGLEAGSVETGLSEAGAAETGAAEVGAAEVPAAEAKPVVTEELPPSAEAAAEPTAAATNVAPTPAKLAVVPKPPANAYTRLFGGLPAHVTPAQRARLTTLLESAEDAGLHVSEGQLDQISERLSATGNAAEIDRELGVIEREVERAGGVKRELEEATEIGGGSRESDALSQQPEGTHATGTTTKPTSRIRSDADVLAAELTKKVGPRPPGHEAHHIVPKGMQEAEEARDILAKADIGINDVDNGIWLPKDSSVANEAISEIHSKVHTERAIREMTEKLRKGAEDGPEGVRRALDSIREELSSRRFER